MYVSKCSEVGVIFLSFWNQSKPFLPTHVGKQKQTNKLEFEWTTDVISIRRISDTEQSVSYYASVVGVFDQYCIWTWTQIFSQGTMPKTCIKLLFVFDQHSCIRS